MAKLSCSTHGEQSETFVCRHIIDSLKDGEIRGFHWNITNGIYEAICSECNELSVEEFQKISEKNIQSLCFGCFKDAALSCDVIID